MCIAEGGWEKTLGVKPAGLNLRQITVFLSPLLVRAAPKMEYLGFLLGFWTGTAVRES